MDFKALVIGTKITSATNTSGGLNSSTGKSDLGVVYLASLRNEDGGEDFSTLAVLRVWGGLEVLKSLLFESFWDKKLISFLSISVIVSSLYSQQGIEFASQMFRFEASANSKLSLIFRLMAVLKLAVLC